jgi:imidazolonepropionase-like amidohydrolase
MRSPNFVSILTTAALVSAQSPPANGPATHNPGWHAFVGGSVVVAPGQRIDNATLVIRGGRVVAVAADTPPPEGAQTHDCSGLVIYPGLVESYLTVDAPAPDTQLPTAHWHGSVLAQRSALDGEGAAKKDREALRSLGFTAAAIAPTGGVLKGTAAVVLLDEPATGEKQTIVRSAAYSLASLQQSFGMGPNSQMGAIALLRQTLADADWYERCLQTARNHPELNTELPRPNDALQALVDHRNLPLAFDVTDELELLRVAKVRSEFARPAFAIGSGMEFRRLAAIAELEAMPLVVPVAFPDTPKVASVAAAEQVSLRQLQSWEHAPSNLARLLNAGVEVAVTTARLDDRKSFRENLAKAMAIGVSADQALAALTTTPARLLGATEHLGSLQPGRIANLVLVDGDLFDPKAPIREVWVGGQQHEIDRKQPDAFDGNWTVQLSGDSPVECTWQVDDGKVKVRFGDEETSARDVRIDGQRIEFLLSHDGLSVEGAHWFRARKNGTELRGAVVFADGSSRNLTGNPTDRDTAKDEKKAEATAESDLTPLPVPLGGYGLAAPPPAKTAALTGATIWTCDGQDPFTGSLLVQDGKIVFVGRSEDMPILPASASVIDCTGMHITPGMIDCHSHTGISRGVNESGEAVTAEVRIQDVVNPDDMNWYRQLAGGVTAVGQLHGSANAIGGQSNTVKLRWAARHPDDMVLQGHMPGIKFALGENPRGANGRGSNDRYPNTRMGVEALIRDRFLAARNYADRLATYEALPPPDRARVMPVRRDLELEALAEILAGRRWVHCHSYRQDEIFMLCGMAREFGFRIGTFQHVLEGYKVAEAIQQAAVGASAFSDWWGYKFEVFDAIPENGAIMHEVGVCVSFNSDSNEHARRLNTEAGKAVKYGGVAASEALMFVTRNPAVQLGIDDRTGSLVRGKDADFVVWSANPLDYSAVCQQTWVDGAPMWTIERDRELRAAAAAERRRLLQKALSSDGDKGDKRGGRRRDAYWAAEDSSEHYCCRDCQGGQR